jgi:hypothetical protein
MTRLRHIKPSPSMVVASLALLVALAGTSVAAVSIVVPRNSVGLLQLKPNSVNSSKVVNGSLLRADFKSGQIPRGERGSAGPQGSAGPAGPTGPAGAAGVAAPGYVADVLSATSTTASSTTSTSFTNLPNGASLNVTVPTGETDKLVVFFSGESACYDGTSLQSCLLKITVDGNELSPAGGSSSIFDNNDIGLKTTSISNSSCAATPCTITSTPSNSFNKKTSADLSEHGIVRVSGNLPAGSHTVQVQYASTSSGTAFELVNWTLVVQRVKVS